MMIPNAMNIAEQTDAPPIDAEIFRAAMKKVATPVTIIATGDGDLRHGMTASAVCSLSDQPPMILACVNRNSAILPHLRANGYFSANFLDEGHVELAQCFAGVTKIYGSDRFNFGKWSTLATGAPILADALSVFDCRLECEYESSTHAVLVGRVEAIVKEGSTRALIYSGGRFGSPTPL
ncbi:flavin reductase (DIM6/NTAB) family NADH-FMN oxidoreductase RutF [Neorhizobium galegae]|uniref:flavin reductase family protein n=1 Tax=Neorhizobium galegae TaxID=399 RepID=UPI001AE74B7E|nr:flavin reductase family protein [Neorhizobium galegae]MBP2561306.1 flavin reductase (DIM6/NTAB) family NADH-FMN oxidoreductase RutF [Neorhizobium galegae]MDQ0134304.1 flavin reductase (DIM6/NTAB) family NADH-FMN oxidoreductase RutF [Neorhizobium galegae]